MNLKEADEEEEKDEGDEETAEDNKESHVFDSLPGVSGYLHIQQHGRTADNSKNRAQQEADSS